MSKKMHVLLQIFIFLLPAVLATCLWQVNEYIQSPLEEFVCYRCGLSGIFLMVVLDTVFDNMSIAASVTITLYLLVLLKLSYIFYRSTSKGLVRFCIWNALVGVWGILSGGFWMTMAMQ